MRRLIAWVSLLGAVCIIGLGAIRLTLPKSEPLPPRQAVLDPGGCPMPCFLGIRLGVTSIQEALQILGNSPYIDPNSISALTSGEGPSTYTVNWRQPSVMLSAIQAKAAGQDIQIRSASGQDVVQMIIVQISVPLGDFLPLFGPPPVSGLVYYQGQGLLYVMEYPAWGMDYNVLWADCKQGQSIAFLNGTTYMLRSPGSFSSALSSTDNIGWHGFTSRPFDQMARQYQCPTIEPPLNGWFARLFG